MADVNANIGVNIDTSAALAQLKALQRQISQFHSSIARSSESAALAQKSLQKNLIGSINSIGAFSAELRTVRTSAESFTNSLEKNKFGMREYFRYAGASTKTFGRLFKSEFDTIGRVAEERVKTLQTQYIKMGRNASGAMEAIAVRPTSLNMQDYGTRTAIAAQKQALFNQLMKQGTTNLLNFGKNTQWAGRQLMVGFTIPLSIVGSTATKTFMEMETQALKFKKVYGDLFTPRSETQAALDNITELGKQFTKYGISVSQTVGLAAEAAAAGFQGLDLQRQTTEATRLSVLGQVDSQKALETTISLQNAFGMSSEKLADSINFLNAVENQTVVSLDDITTAIPKVAPVIQQLGGDVKDLTFFIAAMKEGGINASEGANALKSGLAALINPTKKASDMLAGFGINATTIVEKNKGNLKATVVEFASALNSLDPLARARAIEQMFGKFQFARLSTLFANVAKDGNQAARVLDLANSSVEELSALSEQELGMTADSAMNKFKKSVEDLKVALIPVGKAFLEAATPIIEFVGGVLEKFGNLSDGTKKLITFLTVGIGAIGPIFLMTFGLIANALANGLKGVMILRQGYLRLTGQSQILGEQTQYLNTEQLEAAAAAHSLDQSHAKLTQRFAAETTELNKLIAAYQSATRAAQSFAFNNPGMMMPGRAVKKFASGIVSVPGPKGAGDVVPAMLSPGEAVIPAKFVEKYGPLIQGMVSGNIPGYKKGTRAKSFFNKNKIDELIEEIGLPEGGRLRVPLPVSSPSYSVSGVMAPKSVNTSVGGIGMTKEYLQSPLGRSALGASIQTEIEALGVSSKRASEVLDLIAPQLDTAVQEFDDTIEGWKQASTKAIKNIEILPNLSTSEKRAVRKRLAPIDPDDYTVASDRVLEIKKGKATPRPERKDSSYKVARQKQILAEKGYNTDDFVFAHMPGYEKIEGTKRATTRPPTAGGKTLVGSELATVEKIRSEYLLNQGMSKEQIEKIAKEDSASYKKAIDSTKPEDMYVKSRASQRSAHPLASKDGKDDAAAYSKAQERSLRATKSYVTNYGAGNEITSIDKSIRRQQDKLKKEFKLKDVGPNIAMSPQISQGVKDQAKNLQASNEKFAGLNSKIMGGTFALTSLAGVASMAGGNLGKLSGIVFQLSGVMFALSTVLQIIPGRLKTFLAPFLRVGPLLLFTAALAAGVGIVKLINNAREKERMAIEGLANAITTTKTKLETLGGFFGVTPTSRAGTGAVLSNIQAKPNERSQIQGLKKTEDFQKNFEKDIKALSQATNEEALLALQTLALDLRGQGFAKAQVDIIIKALLEEAKKSKLILEFAQLDLSKEDGRAGAIALAQDITTNFNAEFKKGVQKGRKSYLGIFSGFGPEQLKLTDKQQKQLKLGSQELSNVLAGVSGQFKAGAIKGSEYTDTILKILKPTEDIAYANLLLKETLISINPEYAKATAGVKDYETRLLLLQSALLGVTVAEELVLTTINGSVYEQESARAKIRKMLQQTEKDINNQNKVNAAATKNDKVNQKAIADERLGVISNFFNAQEALIKQNRKSGEDAAQAAIDQSEAKVKAIEKEIDAQQLLVDANQRQVDLLNRRIELEFDRPIQKLQDESTILGNNLEIIRKQEDAINSQYDKQIKSLEKISSINQEIAGQEKSRLTIADALTSGDIATAAAAVQDARAQAAASRIEQQTKALEASRQQALSGITAGGMTKDQIEARTYQIGQQTFLLEQQRKIVQNEITTLQDKNYTLEQGIYSIKQTSLIPAQAQVDKAKLALDEYNKQTDSIVSSITYLGKTQTEWDNVKVRVEAASSAIDLQNLELKKASQITKDIFAEWDKIKSKVITITTNYVTGSNAGLTNPTTQTSAFRARMYGGKILPMAMGGMVPKYMMAGGGVGSDTVPAMLTPGEFVMNKQATKSFGPLLSMLNESKYPSMIGSSYDGKGSGGGGIATSVSDNSSNVYNYSVGITVPQSNANPNDIARAVIGQIKYIDNQRIRGQR